MEDEGGEMMALGYGKMKVAGGGNDNNNNNDNNDNDNNTFTLAHYNTPRDVSINH